MIANIIHALHDQTGVLEHFVKSYDQIAKPISPDDAVSGLSSQEKVFRHCTVFTRLYSIYESFIESVLDTWLDRLPRYRLFTDLDPAFQNAYREGIAKIIRESGRARRYRHLELKDVVAKYNSAICGSSSWEFVKDALTSHERNLRRSELTTLFHTSGLSGVWHFLENDNDVISKTIKSDSNETLERKLLLLVSFRNDASHGRPDEILGANTLLEWVSFIETFCLAVFRYVEYQILQAEISGNPTSVLGVVTEKFSGNIVVAQVQHCQLAIGDTLFFVGSKSCSYTEIVTIQINDKDHASIEATETALEIGIKCSCEVPRNSKLVRLTDYI